MIRLNRIGNKLGLAGVFGILLAGGMVANQMMTEASVGRATDVADRSQRVAESALSAHSNLRQIEIQARNIRMARTQDEVEKNAAGMRRFAAAAGNDIDTAFATAMRPESKERLQKIKSLTSSFVSGVEDFAKTQGNLLAQIDKRSAISMGMDQGRRGGTGVAGAGQAGQPRRDRKGAASGRCQGQHVAGRGLAIGRHRRYQSDSRDDADPVRAQEDFQPVAGRGRRQEFAGRGQVAG